MNLWKTNDLLNLFNHQLDICGRYPYTKDPYKRKYQLLSNQREKVLEEYFKDPKAFIEYSNNMKDIYSNSDEYSLRRRVSNVVFLEIIIDMLRNKNLIS